MSYIDVTGKTEEEAIRKALQQLQMDRDDVSVEILERAKSGFLGIGSSPARVRVTYGQQEPEAPAAPVQESCQDDNARRITEFLTGLLEHMDSPAQVQVTETEKGRYSVVLEGQKLGQLIGRRGETLDAIQQLTNYAVNSGRESASASMWTPRTTGPSASRAWSPWPARWPERSPSIAAASPWSP